MEIILMRHGKPCFTDSPKVTSHEMAHWINHYDLSDIGSDQPSEDTRVLVRKVKMVFSSPLPRAISSVTALNLEPKRVDEIFREAELPVYFIPAIKLAPLSWVFFFRLIWLCGMSKKVESLAMAKRRAQLAVDILVNNACGRNDPVLMMGHGIMNRLIAKELTLRGWKKNICAGKGYWRTSVFQLP